ncbi:SDR family oxidoreductase [Paenibacillus arenosi]|uniref:NmrA family NAD(P)-binding protein n=1 Tax=Paenibacillus arenosi TaxID=2774142 RepID=A0ABR9B3J5_9BACL|nr:NmrA family NAD(P)-binding protein [Paenibacillus arenosi]MBD8500894.1 NmrA family NAD(P)-binding protein [Paenibacillus arenosi]
MTILVTGATGTVGRHVVDQLLRRGQKVRALTRNPQAILPAGVEIAIGDLSDPSTLAAAFEGVSAVHLITTGDEYVPLQTGPEIIALATKSGVRKVTVLWTGGKGTVEQAVEASDLEWTQLHPVEFMSNVRKWTDSIRNEGVVRDLFSGSLNAPVHEADIGRVAAVALTEDGHAGKEYILTGPEVLSVTDQVRIIGEVTGQQLTLLETTEEEEREQMRKMGVREDVINFVISWHLNPPPYAYTIVPTIEEVLGQPAYTFKQWAEENANYFIKS